MQDPSQQRDSLDLALEELYQARVPASFRQNWQSAIVREEKMHMSTQKKRKNLWLRTVLPAAAALVLVIGAAWVGGQNPQNSLSIASSYTSTSRNAQSGASNGAALYAAPMEAATEASYDMAMGGDSTDAQSVTPAAADNRKLVRTADLVIRTDAYDDDLAAINALIASVGGYAESVYADGDGGTNATRSASLTVRVPSAKLDTFLRGLDGVGRIVSRNESVEDKTVQYADNQARLKTLREKLDRLNALLGKAEEVADIIEIESAIADTQYAIDSFETTQRTIDRNVDMSRVDVSLREDSPVAVTSEMSLGQRISAAFSASIEGLGRFLRNMAVFLAMALPVVAVIAVVVVAIVLLRKSARKRKAEKAPEKEASAPDASPSDDK